MNRLQTGGMDRAWRRRMVRLVAAGNPRAVLDLATGSGDVALELQRHIPTAAVTGVDFCLPMLEIAAEKGVRHLICADGLRLPFQDGVFDAVTISFGLRNMESYPAGLREMARVLRPGGLLVLLDGSVPRSVLLPFYRLYVHGILPKIAKWVTGNGDAYQYLGDSIAKFPQGEDMLNLLKNNGFQAAKAQPVGLGAATIYMAQK